MTLLLTLYGRLSELGQHVGHRMVDVLCWRERATKRETRLVNMLLFIKNNVWKVTTCVVNQSIDFIYCIDIIR